jgi:hypothetical protein
VCAQSGASLLLACSPLHACSAPLLATHRRAASHHINPTTHSLTSRRAPRSKGALRTQGVRTTHLRLRPPLPPLRCSRSRRPHTQSLACSRLLSSPPAPSSLTSTLSSPRHHPHLPCLLSFRLSPPPSLACSSSLTLAFSRPFPVAHHHPPRSTSRWINLLCVEHRYFVAKRSS